MAWRWLYIFNYTAKTALARSHDSRSVPGGKFFLVSTQSKYVRHLSCDFHYKEGKFYAHSRERESKKVEESPQDAHRNWDELNYKTWNKEKFLLSSCKSMWEASGDEKPCRQWFCVQRLDVLAGTFRKNSLIFSRRWLCCLKSNEL